MTIKIVTDSTCDLPDELIAEYGITVVPLYINVGDKGYLDGIEISRKEFYELLPDWDTPPTTATPGVDTFRNVYENLAQEGASEILSIHISISLSATVDVARSAARVTHSVPVTVFDSQQLSLGTGFLVLAAARAAKQGMSMSEIIALLEDQTSRTYVIAALDTMEYLRRSGRMHGAVARLGNLLKIKPLLKMHAGEPTAERERTSERAFRRMIEFVNELGPLEQLALVHTNNPQGVEELNQKARNLFPSEEPPLSVNVTPVLGANIGPGVVGFTCIIARETA